MIHRRFFALLIFASTLLTSCVSGINKPKPGIPTSFSPSASGETRVISINKPSPVALETGAISTSTFRYETLFDRNVESDPEVAALPCAPYDTTHYEVTIRTWRCPSLGIEFRGPLIDKVFLYPPRDDFPTGYQGVLPFGLTWADTRASVEQKIGLGDEGISLVNYRTQSGRFGVLIHYQQDTHYQSGLSAQIRLITVWRD